MRRPQRSFPKPDITVAQAKVQLTQFLFGCRPQALADVTVEQLVCRYRGLDARTAEYELTIARQKRAGEG